MPRTLPSELLVRHRLSMLKKALPAAAEGDAAALHQARVASRRMREALPLVSSGNKTRKLERKMRRITRALGPVRELDVTFGILDELYQSGKASRSAVATLRTAIAAERDARRDAMKRRLEDCDVDKLTRRAVSVARKAAAKTPKRDIAARLARARVRAAQRAARLHAAMDAAAGIYLPDRLHDVRIAVKKLRYSMELVRELSRSRATARLQTLRRAQDSLGRMHDLETLIARVRDVQGSASAPALKLSAELDKVVRTLENECRQLHGHYMAYRDSLLKICDAVVDEAQAASGESAA